MEDSRAMQRLRGQAIPVVESPNPATGIIAGLLGGVIEAVKDVRSTLERQERHSPGLFRITPAGSPMGVTYDAQQTRLRVTHWVIAAGAAGEYSVQVGTAVLARCEFPGAGTLVLPLIVTIDGGKDVTTVGPTPADVTDSWLIAYTE